MASTSNKRRARGFRANIPLLIVTAGVLLLVAAGIVAFTGNADNEGAEEGTTITMLDGSMVNLADYRGKTVVVNFWASWCPPCRAEMPMLDAYYQEHKNDDFMMIAVNSEEAAITARTFIQDMGYTFPVGLDEDGRLAREFAIMGLPLTLVYGPDGELVYRHNGLITRDVVEAQVTPLLAQ